MATIEITADSIRRASGDDAYELGRSLVTAGKVAGVTKNRQLVEAAVDGRRIQVGFTASGASAQCACGMAGLCAHAVAAALAWVDTGLDRPSPDLYAVLRTKDRDWLAARLAELATDDPDLTGRLLDAARQAAAFDTGELRADLDDVVSAMAADFDDDYYGEWYPDTEELEEVLDDIEDVLDEAPDAVRELADHAIGLIEGVLDSTHSHGGELTAALERAQDLHYDACAAGSPDPVRLAERLVSGALDSGWGIFGDALPSYAEILGPDGMARYRDLLEHADGRAGASDYTVRSLRESYARAQGGTDAVVELLARHANGPYDLARIAQILITDERHDDALSWLDKGLQDHPADHRLLQLAIECQRRAGRTEKVLELCWHSFTARPSVQSYQALIREADEDAAAWGERAVAHLRTRPGLGPGTLAEVLLLRGDTGGAWEQVQQGPCHHDLRMRAAAAHAQTDPAAVIPFYQDLAVTQVGRGSRSGYREAMVFLRMARDLADRCGKDEEFRSFMTELRAAHPGKRAFHQELSHTDLP